MNTKHLSMFIVSMFFISTISTLAVSLPHSVALSSPSVDEPYSTWWDGGWNCRKKLTFDNTGQTEDLVNFPVLIQLNSTNFDYAKAKSDGSDLRFIDVDDTTELNYHIEDWDILSDSYVWVNVTQINASSSDDYIWMYYNNIAASYNQSPEGTFNENYVGVWNLNETSGTHYDSTSNNNDGTPNIGGSGTQDAIGKIDGADYFDGTDDYIVVGDSNSLDITGAITIEAWVKIGNQIIQNQLFIKGIGFSGSDYSYRVDLTSS